MLEELKTFIAVVECKNFTKASEKINLSQPSVSIHIKNLEKFFGVELIIRSVKQKNIIITESGQLLYRRAKEMINLLEMTKEEVVNLSSSVKGHLKIGATYTIGEYILPNFLQMFCEQYPEVEIEVVIGNTEEISRKVQGLQIDIGLIEGMGHMEEFRQTYFLKDELVLILPKTHELTQKDLSNDALQEQKWVTREIGSGLREYLDVFLTHHQIVPRSKLVFGSNYAIKEAVKNGLGIAMVSWYVAKDAVLRDEVKMLTLEETYYRNFSYILPKDLVTMKVVEVFAQTLESFYQSSSEDCLPL